MRKTSLAVGLAVLIGAALAPGVGATTARIAFSGTATLTAVPSFGIEKVAGNSLHVHDMVLVYDQVMDNPMVTGTMTVTVSYMFGGAGNTMWGTELLQPTAYPGEEFRCTMSGGWDKDGVMQADDRCIGFGPHLDGWQFRSHIEGETSVTGYLFNPGQ